MDELQTIIRSFNLVSVCKASVLLGVGILLAALMRSFIGRWVRKYASLHQTIIIQRFAYYAILLIFTISALDQLGFEMKALLGFAGIFTVSVGFASQTAASNIISGLFMIGEKPFQIGDRIQVDDNLGEVLSLDLLSIKLRRMDNSMIRIPNESLLKSIMINHSRFPIRRFDLILRLGFQEDLESLAHTLVQAAQSHPDCLSKPEPELIFIEYSDTAIKMQFSAWTIEEKYTDFKTSMAILISKTLQHRKINIPSLFEPSKIFYE